MAAGGVDPWIWAGGSDLSAVAAPRKERAELVLASLLGAVLIMRVGDGIYVCATGKLIDAWRELRSVRSPIVLYLCAELVELADALAVRAQLAAHWVVLTEKNRERP
jgi:hypothetical protein